MNAVSADPLRREVELVKESIELVLADMAASSQVKYRGCLNELCGFLGIGWDDLPDVSRAEAMRFLRYCREKKGQRARRAGESDLATKKTVFMKHVILKSIYRHLITHEALSKNPFDFPMLVPNDDAQKRPNDPLPFEYVMRVVDAPGADEEGRRDCAILSILFGCGARRGEISQIRMGNVRQLANGTLCYDVETKGGAVRTRYLPRWASERVGEYLERRRSQGAASDHFLFPGQRPGTAISGSAVYHRFCYWVREAGVPGKFSPHSSRVTMATHMDAVGASLSEIQEVGGWRSRRTVERYIKRRHHECQHPVLMNDFCKPLISQGK